MAVTALSGSANGLDHVLPPLDVLKYFPSPSMARQEELPAAQDPAEKDDAVRFCGLDQELPLKASEFPSVSTATHEVAVAHDTDARSSDPSASCSVQPEPL
jgi:hypothetical protein